MNPIVGKYYIVDNTVVRCVRVTDVEFLAHYSSEPLWQDIIKIIREANLNEIYKWRENRIQVLNNKIREYNDLIHECNTEIWSLLSN